MRHAMAARRAQLVKRRKALAPLGLLMVRDSIIEGAFEGCDVRLERCGSGFRLTAPLGPDPAAGFCARRSGWSKWGARLGLRRRVSRRDLDLTDAADDHCARLLVRAEVCQSLCALLGAFPDAVVADGTLTISSDRWRTSPAEIIRILRPVVDFIGTLQCFTDWPAKRRGELEPPTRILRRPGATSFARVMKDLRGLIRAPSRELTVAVLLGLAVLVGGSYWARIVEQRERPRGSPINREDSRPNGQTLEQYVRSSTLLGF
jgi:hypothetical protein